jgi:hypothetical protein
MDLEKNIFVKEKIVQELIEMKGNKYIEEEVEK